MGVSRALLRSLNVFVGCYAKLPLVTARGFPLRIIAISTVGLVVLGVAVVLMMRIGGLTSDLDTARADISKLDSEKASLEASLSSADESNRDLTETLGEARTQISDLSDTKKSLEGEVATLSTDKKGLQLDLDAAHVEIDGLAKVRDGLTGELETATSQVASLSEDKRGLELDLSSAQSRIGTLESDVEAITEAKGMVESSLEAANKTNSSLSASLRTARSEIGDLETENVALELANGDLQSRLSSSEANNERLTTKNQELQAIVDAVDTIEALTAEILELQLQREPLIPHIERQGFGCTPSMEPKLTCLDEANWLYNFRPEDIVVGSVIAFGNVDECGFDPDTYISHRVMDIKIEDGVYYFWPQGDNNRGPDECWVPDSQIRAYLLEVFKNVRPENAELRDNVLEAKAYYDEAYDDYEEADAKHVAAMEAWAEECGIDDWETDTCSTWTATLDRLWKKADVLWKWSDYYYKVRDSRYQYFDCWGQRAIAVSRNGGEEGLPPVTCSKPDPIAPPV